MTVKIGNIIFENANFQTTGAAAIMVAPASQSISELEELLGGEEVIEVYDGEMLIGKYYSRELVSIAVSIVTEARTVTATFSASALSVDVEQELSENIDDSDDAIIELAGIIAEDEEDISEIKEEIEGIQDDIKDLQSTCDSLTQKMSTIPDNLIQELSRIDSRLNNLADRVAALENERSGSNG